MSLTGVLDGCAWCEEHKDSWSEPTAIVRGFKITRSLRKLQRLWDKLDKNKKTGALIRRKGDFSVRKGLCHQPVTTRDLFHFTVCHKWSHFLDHKVEILIHLMIDHMDWYQWKSVLPAVKEAKRIIQQALKPGGAGANSSNIGK